MIHIKCPKCNMEEKYADELFNIQMISLKAKGRIVESAFVVVPEHVWCSRCYVKCDISVSREL